MGRVSLACGRRGVPGRGSRSHPSQEARWCPPGHMGCLEKMEVPLGTPFGHPFGPGTTCPGSRPRRGRPYPEPYGTEIRPSRDLRCLLTLTGVPVVGSVCCTMCTGALGEGATQQSTQTGAPPKFRDLLQNSVCQARIKLHTHHMKDSQPVNTDTFLGFFHRTVSLLGFWELSASRKDIRGQKGSCHHHFCCCAGVSGQRWGETTLSLGEEIRQWKILQSSPLSITLTLNLL